MSIDIEREVKDMLARLTGFEPAEIKLEADIIDDLGVDSLKFIEVATEIQRKFKVKIEDRQIITLRKVNQAVALLKELLEKKD